MDSCFPFPDDEVDWEFLEHTEKNNWIKLGIYILY